MELGKEHYRLQGVRSHIRKPQQVCNLIAAARKAMEKTPRQNRDDDDGDDMVSSTYDAKNANKTIFEIRTS